MAKLMFITGDYGVGKSYSLRNMPPSETLIINVNPTKELPFKDAYTNYTALNIVNNTGNFAEIVNDKSIQHLITNPEKLLGKNVEKSEVLSRFKYAVIDDTMFTQTREFMQTAKVKSYDKFVDMALNVFNIVEAVRKSPLEYVILVLHTENVYNGNIVIGEKIKTVGKLTDDKVRLEGLTTISLRCGVEFLDNGEAYYHFITNRQPDILARSPFGMLELKMDNDLYKVIQLADVFYNKNKFVNNVK
jgi:hypothetical protein